MKAIKCMVWSAVCGFLYSSLANAVSLDVGLIEGGRAPYFMTATDDLPDHGIYVDALREIGAQTGINFQFKYYPQARLRAYMKHGILDIEPGIDPSWRTEQGEESISLYSDVILSSDEVIVYNPKAFISPPSVDDFKSLQLCTLLGFDLFNQEPNAEKSHDTSKVKPNVVRENQLLKLVEFGRCDYAIFPIDVISKKIKQYGLEMTKPVATYQLRIRLHRDRKLYLEAINNAIASMKKSGKLQAIIDSYTKGSQ
ncbi:substrate-binding periplasmic protein [Vibrio cortegadensis]|uniref:Substrate-binding periplasmic protein n=1 Tax=Vibrio cortegadensis TaxID=1328770 RepID=A0ABV4M962_9VIBR